MARDRLTALNAPNRRSAASRQRPRLGVFKFASCDGCQLSLLDCEDELLAVADRVEIAFFLEATRRPLEGEFDVALVEGSISTPDAGGRDPRHPPAEPVPDHPGACASHGGIQGLRNFGGLDADKALAIVYASPQYVATLDHSRPASDYVAVDLELPGCPINKEQLLGVLAQMLAGSRPRIDGPCSLPGLQAQELVCVLVTQGVPCMGPVTSTGCGVSARATTARASPASGRRSSRTPRRWPAGSSSSGRAGAIRRLFHAFYANAPAFKEEGSTPWTIAPSPDDAPIADTPARRPRRHPGRGPGPRRR